jgi:hypothetical protein
MLWKVNSNNNNNNNAMVESHCSRRRISKLMAAILSAIILFEFVAGKNSKFRWRASDKIVKRK